MKTPLLVLDVHYLCHRAFHSNDGLSHHGRPTGVIFSFLKTISLLKEEFQTDRVAFCFEHPKLFRYDIYPEYKQKRKRDRTEKERREYNNLRIQISELQQRYLPKIGFKNIFCFRGYESDDIMAAIAKATPENHETILVTADSDMYQCLSPEVSIYSPQKRRLFTEGWFWKTYGIAPRHWAIVKAIAGCHSDNIKGVPGIGEKTALKWLLDDDCQSSARVKIRDGRHIIRRNRKLVELPFEGCPTPKIAKDNISKPGWQEVCDILGMKSIASKPPVFRIGK